MSDWDVVSGWEAAYDRQGISDLLAEVAHRADRDDFGEAAALAVTLSEALGRCDAETTR
jgi:hypothetical protein